MSPASANHVTYMLLPDYYGSSLIVVIVSAIFASIVIVVILITVVAVIVVIIVSVITVVFVPVFVAVGFNFFAVGRLAVTILVGGFVVTFIRAERVHHCTFGLTDHFTAGIQSGFDGT